MIRMDDGLLADQVVFPLFHTLDQGIQFLVVSGVIDYSLGELLRMVINWLLLLQKYNSHGVPTGISFNPKSLMEIR